MRSRLRLCELEAVNGTLAISTLRQLLDDVERVRQEHAKTASFSAANYNVFTVLGVESKEVTTHSAFLAHLFDPTASHCQGPLFLERFLADAIGGGIGLRTSIWTAQTEWVVPGGRIDILLQSKDEGTICVIENKIYASDGPAQLSTYRAFLDSASIRRAFPKRRELLYLTLNGSRSVEADEQGISYTTISYANHIASLLRTALPKIKAPPVAHTVEQYLRTVETLTSHHTMNDDLERQIIDVLAEPRNLATALVIARCADHLRRRILTTFWTRGRDYLASQLSASAAAWDLVSFGDALASKHGLNIVTKGAKENAPLVVFCFFQFYTNSLFRWERCVKFDNWNASDALALKIQALPEAAKLRGRMEKLSLVPKHGWDGYCLLTEDAKGLERIMEEESIDGRYFRQVFEAGWMCFQELEPSLSKLNAVIARLKK